MPAPFPIEDVERARKMYEDDGYSPGEIADAFYRQTGGRFRQIHRSTISGWVGKYGWKHHRHNGRAQSRDLFDPQKPFSVSGISDPIYHLARVEALKYVNSYDIHARVGEIVASTLLHVASELDPGERVYRQLKPLIRAEVRRLRQQERSLRQYGRSDQARKDIEEERKRRISQ